MSDPDVDGPDPGDELSGAVQLVDFPAQVHEYQGHLHGLSGTLPARSGPPASLEARILLPVSHRDRRVGAHCHVLRADHLLSLLPAIDGLDVMQHNLMPHWTGHCALLDVDIAAAPQGSAPRAGEAGTDGDPTAPPIPSGASAPRTTPNDGSSTPG